jgi:hypothetical protein
LFLHYFVSLPVSLWVSVVFICYIIILFEFNVFVCFAMHADSFSCVSVAFSAMCSNLLAQLPFCFRLNYCTDLWEHQAARTACNLTWWHNDKLIVCFESQSPILHRVLRNKA